MKNGLILIVLICRDDTASIKAASSKIDVTKVLRRRNRIIWEQRNENNNVVGIYNRKLIKHKGIFHSFISFLFWFFQIEVQPVRIVKYVLLYCGRQGCCGKTSAKVLFSHMNFSCAAGAGEQQLNDVTMASITFLDATS